MKRSVFEKNGKAYQRAEFDSFEELEAFFVAQILGGPYKSKVIGKVLIYWSA